MNIQTLSSRWTKAILAAALLLAVIPHARALITASTYPASAATGVALIDMSSGTTQLLGPNLDDDPSSVTDIGFDFWYDGVRYTQFSVNPNGVCRLGSTVVTISYDNSADFAATTNSPKICPYFDDLVTGSNGKVHYKVIGAAPNRTLVVEWLNMQIPSEGAGSPGAGIFQLWLSESTGVIAFVYGNGVVDNPDGAGYSVGLQSGAATNFTSVTTAGMTVSYTTANNSQANSVTSGSRIQFTPNTPLAPTGLTFTNISPLAMKLNWTDHATNEVGFVIYQSLDGTNFNFVTQLPANSNSFTASGLTPGTTYFWRVYAVTEGKLSTVLTGSQATAAAGNIVSVTNPAQVRNWSATSTWVGGVVPTIGDNVTIAANREVVIDTAANAYSLTLSSGSLLRFEPTTARTLTVATSVNIPAGATLTTSLTQASTQTGHVLSVGGDLTNGGTLDFSTYPGADGTSAGAKLLFTGVGSSTFSGPGQKTDLRDLEINKGTSAASVLLMNFSGAFTVQGVANAGFLTLTNGTLRIAGSAAMTSPVFKTATYVVPATAGLWLDDPNFIVAGTASADTTLNSGLLRISQGTYNIGLTGADGIDGSDGAVFLVEGGSLNCAGVFAPQGAVSYTQTGGAVNVAQVGNTQEDTASFELYSFSSSFNMSGGSIVLHQRNSSGIPIDYRVQSSTVSVTNSNNPLLNVGANDSPAGTTFQVQGPTPNIIVAPNMTMSAADDVIMQGANLTNNGTIVASALGSFIFAGLGPMSYNGAGTFGTLASPFAGNGVACASPGLVTLNAPIVTNRVDLTQGGFVHSNQLSIVTSGTSIATVNIGGGGPIIPGGSFDVSPTFNPGDQPIVNYLTESGPHTTGLEIPSSRSLTSLTVDNPNNVTLSGGNLTLNAAGSTALYLTNGRLITGGNTVVIQNASGTTQHTAGWVDGNLQKRFSANGAKTFEVGTVTGYSPVSINVTSGAASLPVTVRANQGQYPNYPPGYPSYPAGLRRYWTILDSGNLTANLTFFYLDSDVVGVETNYKLGKYSAGAFTQPSPQSASFAMNVVAANTQTAISGDWILIESDVDFDGLPDSYELAHTSPPSTTSLTPNGDEDGDGQSNLAEYFAGTDPLNSSSALRITSISYSPGNPFSVNFNAVALKRYRLEYKNALTDVNWQNAGLPDLVPGVTGTSQFSDLSPAPPKKFYRVNLVQP